MTGINIQYQVLHNFAYGRIKGLHKTCTTYRPFFTHSHSRSLGFRRDHNHIRPVFPRQGKPSFPKDSNEHLSFQAAGRLSQPLAWFPQDPFRSGDLKGKDHIWIFRVIAFSKKKYSELNEKHRTTELSLTQTAENKNISHRWKIR